MLISYCDSGLFAHGEFIWNEILFFPHSFGYKISVTENYSKFKHSICAPLFPRLFLEVLGWSLGTVYHCEAYGHVNQSCALKTCLKILINITSEWSCSHFIFAILNLYIWVGFLIENPLNPVTTTSLYWVKFSLTSFCPGF